MPERKSPVRKTIAPKKPATAKKAAAPIETCPRCGTPKFGPEQRIRAEGNRTVRYSILVCERGHTFARGVAGPSRPVP